MTDKLTLPRIGILLAVLMTALFAGRAMQADAVAATVTSITPNSGPVIGGTSVTIAGTGFGTAGTPLVTAVSFGGTAATAFAVVDNTTLTATAPAHTAGVFNVVVTTDVASADNGANDNFTYTAVAPTVTNLNPTTGTSAGGNPVVITGSAFLGLTGAGGVTFGGTNATNYTVNSDTQITAVAPPHSAGVSSVIVTHPTNGASANTGADDYLYLAAPQPTISMVAPTTGTAAGGTNVVITGSGFFGATAVTFGGANATSFEVDSNSQITAVTPAHAPGATEVFVTTTAGNTNVDSASNNFTFTSSGPTITGLNPTGGALAGGNPVTITGTGFGTPGAPLVTAVSFGGTPALFTVVNDTTLNVTAPPRATAGTVNVTVSVGAVNSPDSAADNYTYGVIPTVTSVNPASGHISGNTVVVITGTGFLGATGVTFGGTAGTLFTVNSDTQITVTSPAKAAGTVDVIVIGAAGSSANTTADNFTYTAGPTVTGLTPSSGGPAAGASIVITGTGFTGATAVAIGATAATSFSINSATQITAVFPALTPGVYAVRVTTPLGTSPDTANDNYLVGTAPTITSISPTTGVVGGGTSVTITGAGFTGATAVLFGTTPATSFVIVNDTTITAVAPAGTSGVVSVRVTTPLGQTADTTNDNFTYGSGTTTTTYTLYFRWTLIVWQGRDNADIAAALAGQETPDNPNTNNITGVVTAIFHYLNAQQRFEGYFPGSANIPGANDFTTFQEGEAYWIAISQSGSLSWTVLTD